MKAPEQPARRFPIWLGSILALMLCIQGCKPQTPATARAPAKYLTIFASSAMEPAIRTAETLAREQQLRLQINLQIGGAQSLAWLIEDGERPDLYIGSTIAMVEELVPKPRWTRPWLDDSLVVITRADDPNPILRRSRALERSTGRIAVGGVGTQLGDSARLAMRYAEIWPLVEGRMTQHSSTAFVLDALRRGDVDLAIVFASDAARSGDDLFITDRLELPEKMRIVYTLAAYTDLGAEFADLLHSPDVIEEARAAGYTPVEAVSEDRENLDD